MVNWALASFNWQRTRHANMSGPFFFAPLPAPLTGDIVLHLVHYPGKEAYLLVFIVNFWNSQFIK